MQSCTTPNGSAKKKKNKQRRKKQARKAASGISGLDRNQALSNRSTMPASVQLASFGVSPAVDAHIRNLLSSYVAKAAANSLDPKKVLDYSQCLLAPTQFMCRYPDSWSDNSQLLRMVMEFSVPITLNTLDPDSGRMSFLVSPSLGSTADPTQYKVAVVKTSVDTLWSELDFSSPLAYQDVIEGRDVRVDTFFQILTQPSLGCLTIDGTGAGLTAPFATFDVVAPSYNLIVTQGTTLGSLVLPQGIFRVTLAASAPAPDNFTLLAYGGSSVDNLSQHVAGDLTFISVTCAVSTNQSGVTILCSGTDWGTAELFITTTFFTVNTDNDSAPIPLEGGVLNTYRPVAMSCLASYTGPSLTDGGNFVAALLPGSASAQNYFTSNPGKSLGQLQNWENLAQIPGALKDSKMKDGAYCYWKPEKISDSIFYTATQASTFAYPTMCFSGTFVPGSDVPDGQQNVLKVVVATVYEQLSTSQLWEEDSLVGSQATIDFVNKILAGEPTSMENPAHKNFISRMIAKVKQGVGWGVKNAGKIAKGVETAAEIGAMFL